MAVDKKDEAHQAERDAEPLINAVRQCNDCVNRYWGTITCLAFPERIPHDIINGDHDHRLPYPDAENPTDQGIRFELNEGLITRDPNELGMKTVFNFPPPMDS
jgi:hypothetical protein